MGDPEKLLFLQLLLMDMRGSFPSGGDVRLELAERLAEELKETTVLKHIRRFETDNCKSEGDGRHFAVDYENGGYYGMQEIHRLPFLAEGRSAEFRKMCVDFLEYPDHLLEDWKAHA